MNRYNILGDDVFERFIRRLDSLCEKDKEFVDAEKFLNVDHSDKTLVSLYDKLGDYLGNVEYFIECLRKGTIINKELLRVDAREVYFSEFIYQHDSEITISSVINKFIERSIFLIALFNFYENEASDDSIRNYNLFVLRKILENLNEVLDSIESFF